MNDLSKNPMVLDTAGITSGLQGKRVILNFVEWVSPSAVDESAVLKDANGNVIFNAICTTAKQNLIKYFGGAVFIGELNIETLDSGKLLLQLDNK